MKLAFFVFLLALGRPLAASPSQINDLGKIPVGSSLFANPHAGPLCWLSPSGRFAFGFFPHGGGIAVGITLSVSYQKTEVVWQQNIDPKDPLSKDAVLNFTPNGFLLTPKPGAHSTTLIKFNVTASSAAMLDNGNFIVSSSDSNISSYNCGLKPVISLNSTVLGTAVASCFIWRSFDYPTDTMMGGQFLPNGSYLVSTAIKNRDSFHTLVMQNDSNLVIYEHPRTTTAGKEVEKAIWASNTYHEGYTELVLEEDGRLYLSSPTGAYRELSQSRGSEGQQKMLYRANLSPDKYFRLYALNLTSNQTDVVYEVPTLNDVCQFKGACGRNSYCLVSKSQPVCRCLPGFNQSKTNDKCRRTRAAPICRPDRVDIDFSMEKLENLVCFDEPYSMVSAASQEECSNLCLGDCNCAAAVFSGQYCRKYKLPMSHAMKVTNETKEGSTMFVKVASSPESEESQEARVAAMLALASIDAGVFLALVAASAGSYWLLVMRYRLRWQKWELALKEEIAPRCFSFTELALATESFSTELGSGGHGTVYKGKIVSLTGSAAVLVAVKRLNRVVGKVEKDFQAEMKIIGRAYHVNLVRLLGFCYEGSNRLLVYELMSRGSLADHIFKPLRELPGWELRAGILLGVVRGIHYLHSECETKILHRDIKPENILIAENWTAKIADFGISKLVTENNPTTTIRRATAAPGTEGYMAPECLREGGDRVTEKADVYSFGVVVLETIFCEKMSDGVRLRQLTEDTKPATLVEEEQRFQLQWRALLKVGISCVQEKPDKRPFMEDILILMENILVKV